MSTGYPLNRRLAGAQNWSGHFAEYRLQLSQYTTKFWFLFSEFGMNKNRVTRTGRCISHIFSKPVLQKFAYIYDF
jgi:hypothetical protein